MCHSPVHFIIQGVEDVCWATCVAVVVAPAPCELVLFHCRARPNRRRIERRGNCSFPVSSVVVFGCRRDSGNWIPYIYRVRGDICWPARGSLCRLAEFPSWFLVPCPGTSLLHAGISRGGL